MKASSGLLYATGALLIGIVGLGAVSNVQGAIKPGAPFADNAILQRDMPVPVWGWSKPGAKVTVQFAGQTQTATAGADGRWMLQLDKLNASFDPAQMVIRDNHGNTVTLKNILVGEVWMATGQSNMQWVVSKCNVGRVLLPEIQKRVEAGEIPQPIVREGKVTDFFSALHPIEHATLEWSSNTGEFSAIATAFAYKLATELKVPVGILNGAFSTTKIQAWIPRVGFRDGKDDYTQNLYRQVLETDPTTPQHKQAWNKFYQDIEDTLQANADRIRQGKSAKPISTKTPGNLNGNRDSSWMYNARVHPLVPYAIRGAIWNQGYASQGEGLRYYENLHSMVRGWRLVWDRPDLPVYFHQFYCASQKGEWDNSPSIGSTAEMRLGTWLARDIPNANMASQIDISGSIHYYNKTVPGRRLALHALKNQYGKQIVADGPMFKSYTVRGSKLIVEFDHAENGLVVGETGSNSKGIATPTVIENGDDRVELFYLADENRLWHPAKMKIDGNRVILTAPGVKSPRGVSYATGGVGPQPNLYNRALLPATPFIYYNQKLVTSETWPDEKLKVAGEKIDPATVGKVYEYRKMPLLSVQFRDNAVLQADVPITIWGSAIHDWGYEAEGDAKVHFSFNGIEKTIPVKPGMKEWQVTLPPMKAGAEPKTLKVTLTIDGELAHERIAENVVIGDVWYVAAPPLKAKLDAPVKSSAPVRMMWNKSKRDSFGNPSRYSVCVSTTPDNRFASVWAEAEGFAAALGHRIGARTGRPVGIILMQTKTRKKEQGPGPVLKGWIPVDALRKAPSLMEDYKDLASVQPGNEYYDANARRYIAAWKTYWSEYITRMMKTKAVPDGAAWGSYPTIGASVSSKASQVYNVMTHCFGPGSFKGVLFLCGEEMFAGDQGANYGSELTALANSWKNHFRSDPHFFYTLPDKSLAPKITTPSQIQGKSSSLPIQHWLDGDSGAKQLNDLLDQVVRETYEK